MPKIDILLDKHEKYEYDFYLFIFYEDKRKDKTPSGISFPRAFPKPEKWVGFGYTLLLSHTESLLLEFDMNMVIGKTYDRPHGLLMCMTHQKDDS